MKYQSAHEGGSRFRFIVKWAPLGISSVYAVSVVVLAALTSKGILGDHLYGHILMLFMAFPLSLLGVAVDFAVEGISPQVLTSVTAEWTSLLWPGLLQALLLWWLLRREGNATRSERRGWTLAVLTTFLVLVSGVIVIFDQWVPRKIGGVPLLVLGVLQAFFLFALFQDHRSAVRSPEAGT